MLLAVNVVSLGALDAGMNNLVEQGNVCQRTNYSPRCIVCIPTIAASTNVDDVIVVGKYFAAPQWQWQ